MKNLKIYTIITMFSLLAVFSIANAQTDKDETKGIREQVKEQAKEQERSENQENKLISIKQRIDNRYGRMASRFQATIERVEMLMARMVSRVEKMKSAGADTTKAEQSIADAKTHIADAKTSLAKLKTIADSADSSTATTTKAYKDILKELQKTSTETQKHIREAHTSLTKSIGLLLGLKFSEVKNASSTKSN